VTCCQLIQRERYLSDCSVSGCWDATLRCRCTALLLGQAEYHTPVQQFPQEMQSDVDYEYCCLAMTWMLCWKHKTIIHKISTQNTLQMKKFPRTCHEQTRSLILPSLRSSTSEVCFCLTSDSEGYCCSISFEVLKIAPGAVHHPSDACTGVCHVKQCILHIKQITSSKACQCDVVVISSQYETKLTRTHSEDAEPRQCSEHQKHRSFTAGGHLSR